jgi:hypothetical protein
MPYIFCIDFCLCHWLFVYALGFL